MKIRILFSSSVAWLAILAATGCSIRGLAVNALANSLAASGDVFASDEDPELVRDALPFALKTMETLLAEKPDHPGLLLGACQGFTQYGYAFVEPEGVELEYVDYARATEAFDRALKLYLRAREYCWRALEIASPGVIGRLQQDATEPLSEFGREHLSLLFWGGASWGAALSLGQDRPEIAVDFPAVRSLLSRVLELDESFDDGAIHEVLISIEALPESMGGSRERARRHFARAVELGGGRKAAPYVALASALSVPEQNRGEFVELLETALAIDVDREPGERLANLIAQRRARWLLEQVDELFLE
ncbi:MAG: TRAP transporter TatT component family protein [Acidobacteriota bacterium]|nr:TRAP transporter TatT component family protein [Acidobacteriota bacterium]